MMLIVGENEVNEGKVAIRIQGEGDQGSKSLDEFITFFNSKL